MIRHVTTPDKIWDLKYSKNNKLLHKSNISDDINSHGYSDCITTTTRVVNFPPLSAKAHRRRRRWFTWRTTIGLETNPVSAAALVSAAIAHIAVAAANVKLRPYNRRKANNNTFTHKIIYSFLIILYCCCVMIAATNAGSNNNNNNNTNLNANVTKNNNYYNSSLVKSIQNLHSINDSQIYNSSYNDSRNNNINRKAFGNNNNNNNSNSNSSIYEYNSSNDSSISNVLNTTANVINFTEENYPVYLQTRKILEASNTAENEEDYFEDDDDDERDYKMLISNKSGTTFNLSRSQSIKEAKGMYVGAPCEVACHPDLHHVLCDKSSSTCECDKNYPVVIGLTRGCAKPKKLGEQCFYHQTCVYNDANSLCVQISHNALCQCADGFHSVSYSKPTKRVFCTQDLAVLTSDLPTLLGVTSGIAVLAGLICMVLHLFTKTKYPRHRNFADANIPPPIMYSSDTGIPLTVQSGRPSSRSSFRSSGSIGSYGNRRPSSAPQTGSKGVLVSTSRTGSRRPSLASIHSTSSSVRSYSMMRFEKEIQQKELRHEMKLRLSRLQHQHNYNQHKPHIIVGDISHGSVSKAITPITPNSMDELLPAVDESQEIFSPKLNSRDTEDSAAYNGPCSSSTECL